MPLRNMTYEQFDNKIKRLIAELSYPNQINFSLSICKKLYFYYEVFSKANNWGDPDALLDAMNYLNNNDPNTYNLEEINDLLKAIEIVTPDTEDFDECSYSLNASCAVIELLNFVRDKKSDRVYSVSTMLMDTVDFKIREISDFAPDQVDQHPLMIETRNWLLNLTQ